MMDKFTSQFQSVLGQAQSMALGLGISLLNRYIFYRHCWPSRRLCCSWPVWM